METTTVPHDGYESDVEGTWTGDAVARVGINYAAFPRQRDFHKSPAKYRLFGGAAGPGKSKALLMEAIAHALDHDGSNTLVLRRTFPELEQSLLLYFRRDVPRSAYRSYQDSKHIVTWWNGSTTRFGYCQNENDVYQYQGAEFLFIGIDELTLFTLRQWQFLTSRNRCPIRGTTPCMAGATNPGNIGHAWVKSLWIDKVAPSGMEDAQLYDPNDYAFIPARVSDNPIYAADENYLKTLRSLPSNLRRAFLDGDWDVFAGQYFDKFNPEKSVVRAEQFDWRPWWPRWISVDWGFEHPAAAYWHAAVLQQSDSRGATEQGQENGYERSASRRVATYREMLTRHTSPRELAREIVARSICRNGTGTEREKIDAIYLSPDAFARRTDESSIAEQMGDVFAEAGFPRPVQADNDRVGGWMLMYQMLDAGEWVITDNCAELIRTLPTLVRDSAYVEDVAKVDGDDSADAARYGLKSRCGAWGAVIQAPFEQRVAERVTSADPTVRAIQAQRALLQESQRRGPVFSRRRPRW